MVTALGSLALGSAASAATASTVATAATGGLFGFGGSFTLGATLSTVGTAFSALSSLTAGRAEESRFKSEALLNEFNSKQEEIRGKEEANAIRQDVAVAIASANARGGASGIDISSGSPVTATKEALAAANRSLSTVGTNARISAETEKVRAQLARRRGAQAVRSGQAKAVSLLGDFATEQADRGAFSF